MPQKKHGIVIIRIQALLNSFKSAEYKLANYILENSQEVVHLTIQDLEKKSGASYATIIRFCKKIGFSGYKDFRSSLIHDAMQSQPQMPISDVLPIQPDDNVETIIEKTFNSSNQILKETQQILDPAVLLKAVKKIIAAHEVYFIGTGSSGVTAQYAFSRFFRIGIPCSSEIDATLFTIKASILTKNDLLFTISSSGRSKSIVNAARIANEHDVTVISLCDFAISPLSRASTIQLYTTPGNTTQFLDMEMPLFVGQINIIDVLFLCCCMKLGEKAFNLYHLTKCTSDLEKQ